MPSPEYGTAYAVIVRRRRLGFVIAGCALEAVRLRPQPVFVSNGLRMEL